MYRFLLTLVFPVALVLFGLRLLRGRETWDDVRQRLGYPIRTDAPRGTVIWLHGASVGELNAARALIDQLTMRDPTARFIITTNTLTGRKTVTDWALDHVTVTLAPFDLRWCLRRFLAGYQPNCMVTLENELWPNRILEAAAACGTVAILSGRFSDRSLRFWQRFPGLAPQLARRINLVSAQNAQTEDRYRAFGIAPGSIAAPFTLKSTRIMPPPNPARLAAYQQVFDRDATILAASTHDSEEAAVLSAYLAARATRPALKLILAPRHPNRADEIVTLLKSAGVRFAQRSAGDTPSRTTDVYLADTLGEMPLWYALSGVTFLGGSLVAKGGHTPYEPAQAGSAILHGPSTENFTEVFAELHENNAALQVANPMELGQLFRDLPSEELADMAARAQAVLTHPDPGALDNLIDRLAENPGMGRLIGAP